MKKDFMFAPILLVLGASLFLLKLTGMPAHIAISVIGIVILAAYTVLTKKEWKIPALEIAARAFYGIALISGVVIKIEAIVALAIIHKIFAALFVVSLAVLLIHKIITRKR